MPVQQSIASYKSPQMQVPWTIQNIQFICTNIYLPNSTASPTPAYCEFIILNRWFLFLIPSFCLMLSALVPLGESSIPCKLKIRKAEYLPNLLTHNGQLLQATLPILQLLSWWGWLAYGFCACKSKKKRWAQPSIWAHKQERNPIPCETNKLLAKLTEAKKYSW